MQKFVTIYYSLDIICEYQKNDMIKISFTKVTVELVIIMIILKKVGFMRMNF